MINARATAAYAWATPPFPAILWGGYRLVWVGLALLSMLSIFYLAPRQEAESQAAQIAAGSLGFSLVPYPVPDGQMIWPRGDAGRQIGFQQEDVLLSVDGQVIPKDKRAETRLLAGAPGMVAHLSLRRSSEERYSVSVARDPARLQSAFAGSGLTLASRGWLHIAFESVTNLVGLAAAGLLFLRRPRDPLAQFLAFALLLETLTLSVLSFSGMVSSLKQVLNDGLLLIGLLFFPTGRLPTRWHVLALVAIIVDKCVYVGCVSRGWSWTYISIAETIAFSCLLIAVGVQIRHTRDIIVRQQSKYILFSILLYSVVQIILWLMVFLQPYLSYPWQLRYSLLEEFAFAVGFMFIPAGILISVLRFRLYDAEAAISRSVAYGALTIFLVAIFAGSEKIIEILGEEYFGQHLGALAGGLGAAIAAVMVGPLHRRVTHWAERRFQGDLVHLRNGLPILVGDMRETASPRQLADAVLARVETGVRAAHGAVVIGRNMLDARDVETAAVATWLQSWDEPSDNVSTLRVDRDDPLFPLRLPLYAEGVGVAGWLLLGPRPDGSFYGKDERDTLRAIADPVARALVIARERERSLGGISAEISMIKGWLEDLRAHVGLRSWTLAKAETL